ncbi:MAG: DUF885 family protein [Planctomycetota bacterium]|nr:DUF885 family protein [Planctomycetota bacterium]
MSRSRNGLLFAVLLCAFLAALAAGMGYTTGAEPRPAIKRLEAMEAEYFEYRWDSKKKLSSRDYSAMAAFARKWKRSLDAGELSAGPRRDLRVMLQKVEGTLEWRRLSEQYTVELDDGRTEPGNPPPEAAFEYRFRYQFGLDATPLRAAQVARQEWDRTWDRLEDIARAWWNEVVAAGEAGCNTAGLTDTHVDWRTYDEQIKREHPEGKELLTFARRALNDARDFAIRNELVTIPDWAADVDAKLGNYGVAGVSVPFGYYQPSWESEDTDSLRGAYVVSPLSKRLSPADRLQFLRGNNVCWTRVVALHEAIPGHHLQFAVTARKASRVRKTCHNPAFIEGWALYCEGMMARNGYFQDRRERLQQQKMRLWRCARVLIDLGLHVGGMTKEEAKRLLVEKVGIEPFAAELEVSRYGERPFYQSAYLLGSLEFESMGRDLELRAGEAFAQRDFHDRLLDCGPIPLNIVRGFILDR